MHSKVSLSVVAVAVVMLIAFAFDPPAEAYAIEGPRWPDQPSPGGCCATLTYRNQAAYGSDLTTGTHGASAWNSSQADVTFSISSSNFMTFGDIDNSSVGWDGLTSYNSYTGGNGIKYFYSGMTVVVNYHFLKSYSSGKAQSVAAHEFGHSLGLDHVTAACELMNRYTSTRYSSSCNYINTPRGDDINGANSLY